MVQVTDCKPLWESCALCVQHPQAHLAGGICHCRCFIPLGCSPFHKIHQTLKSLDIALCCRPVAELFLLKKRHLLVKGPIWKAVIHDVLVVLTRNVLLEELTIDRLAIIKTGLQWNQKLDVEVNRAGAMHMQATRS